MSASLNPPSLGGISAEELTLKQKFQSITSMGAPLNRVGQSLVQSHMMTSSLSEILVLAPEAFKRHTFF